MIIERDQIHYPVVSGSLTLSTSSFKVPPMVASVGIVKTVTIGKSLECKLDLGPKIL